MKNIVLIGMMGSGKTTCGQLLANRLGRPFVDCDTVIEGFAGRSIPDIFAAEGEEAFRDLESQVIRELSRQEGLVIATGGGAILRQANVAALRDNGTIVFLNRPAGEIFDSVAMDGRPLAQDGKEAFEATFRLRLPSYRTAADVMVFDFSSPEATVDEILSKVNAMPKKFLVINGPNLNLLGKRASMATRPTPPCANSLRTMPPPTTRRRCASSPTMRVPSSTRSRPPTACTTASSSTPVPTPTTATPFWMP